jgi:hypothetical protein
MQPRGLASRQMPKRPMRGFPAPFGRRHRFRWRHLHKGPLVLVKESQSLVPGRRCHLGSSLERLLPTGATLGLHLEPSLNGANRFGQPR